MVNSLGDHSEDIRVNLNIESRLDTPSGGIVTVSMPDFYYVEADLPESTMKPVPNLHPNSTGSRIHVEGAAISGT